jgi:hypothetical protein
MGSISTCLLQEGTLYIVNKDLVLQEVTHSYYLIIGDNFFDIFLM